MYKRYYREITLCIFNYCTYSNNVYYTRQCDKMLFLKQIRTPKKQMTISYHGVKLWNSIVTNIKNCKNVSPFKHKYKLCFHVNCNRMHCHAKCRLVFTPYVIFDVCLEMLIYVTKPGGDNLVKIALCYELF